MSLQPALWNNQTVFGILALRYAISADVWLDLAWTCFLAFPGMLQMDADKGMFNRKMLHQTVTIERRMLKK